MAGLNAARRHGPGPLIGEGQERVALGAGEAGAALLAGKQHHKGAGQQQAEKQGYRDDRHGVEMSAPIMVFSGPAAAHSLPQSRRTLPKTADPTPRRIGVAERDLCHGLVAQDMRKYRQTLRRSRTRLVA
jgi:hypothetical protein